MPDDNELPPQDGQPEGPAPDPQDVLKVIGQMIEARLDQRMGQVAEQMQAMENRLAQRISEGLAQVQANSQATTPPIAPQPAPTASVSETKEIALPPFPEVDRREMAVSWLFDTLNDPKKLAETAKSFAEAVQAVTGAFRKKDDFLMAREIAARTPAAIILTAPDPLQGGLPNLLSNMIQQGVRIGGQAKAAAGGGTIPLGPPNPPNSPENSPGAPPGTSPAPQPRSTGLTGGSSGTALASQGLEDLDDNSINTLMAQLALISHRRKAA